MSLRRDRVTGVDRPTDHDAGRKAGDRGTGTDPEVAVTTVNPVLVTVEPPRTAKVAADPRMLAIRTRSSHCSSACVKKRVLVRFRRGLPWIELGLGIRHVGERSACIIEVS